MLVRHSKPNCKVSEAFGENVNKMNNQGLIILVFFNFRTQQEKANNATQNGHQISTNNSHGADGQ